MRRLALAAAALGAAVLAAPALAQPGTLDPSFGDGGIGYFCNRPAPLPTRSTLCLLSQTDGGDLSQTQTWVERLIPGGDYMDPLYGDGGARIVDAGPGQDEPAQAIPLADGGALVVGGAAGVTPGTSTATVFRLQANGSLAPSFGSGGVWSSPLAAGPLAAGVVDDTGRLTAVAAGSAVGAESVTLVRLTASGQPDATFGPGGVRAVAVDLPGTQLLALSLVQATGRLLVGGFAFSGSMFEEAHPFVAAIAPDGTLDATFGTGGVVRLPVSPGASGFGGLLAADGDGALVASAEWATGEAAFRLTRLTATGTVDSSFGDAGIATILYPPGGLLVAGVSGLLRDAAGGLLVSVTRVYGSSLMHGSGRAVTAAAMARPGATVSARSLATGGSLRFEGSVYRFAGSHLDAGFGDGGEIALDGAFVADLAVRPTGEILASGLGLDEEGTWPPFFTAQFVGGQPVASAPDVPAASRAGLSLAGPNPFTGGTRVRIQAAAEGRLLLVDVQGRTVRRLASGSLAAGQTVRVGGDGLAAGLYTVCLDTVAGRSVLRVVQQ